MYLMLQVRFPTVNSFERKLKYSVCVLYKGKCNVLIEEQAFSKIKDDSIN